jgi:hypothetical protein
MSALYMLRNPTGYFALLFLAIARPVTVDVLVVRILYLACMKDSKMQAGSISMNVVEGIKVILELDHSDTYRQSMEDGVRAPLVEFARLSAFGKPGLGIAT